MAQVFAMDAFWSRYGKTDFDDTSFAKAIDRLPAISEAGPWVAGGSLRRLIAGLPQDSDFDFFFANEAQFDAFCKEMKKRGGEAQHENDFNVTFILPKVKGKPIGDDEFSPSGPELKVQAIRIAFYPSLAETIEAFDFSLCKFGYDGTSLVCGDYSLFDLASKKLVPDRISYGTSTLRRIIKYTKQGYTICGGGLANILQQIADDPSLIQAEVEYVD
jgi:hypothetical protein